MHSKKWLVLLSLSLILLLIAAVGVVFFAFGQNESRPAPKILHIQPQQVNEQAIDAFKEWKKADAPLMPTGTDDIFYAMTADGDVSFFKKDGQSFSSLRADGQYKMVLSCSREEIPVTITYIEQDGKTEGYGLFVNRDPAAQVHYYEYVFCRLCTPPASLAKDDDLLLMLDYSPARLYAEKEYGDLFYYNSADGQLTPVFSQAQRGLDKGAKLRTDYTVITDYTLEKNQNPFLFFSGRMYATDSGQYDIYATGTKDAYNTDNNRFVKDVLAPVFYQINGKVTYWQEKPTGNGFVLTDADGQEFFAFDGSFNEDYLLHEELLLQKSNGQILNVSSGQTSAAPLTVVSDAIALNSSKNGRYFAVLAEDEQKGATIYFYDTQQQTSFMTSDPVWMQTVGIHVTDDGCFVVCVAYDEGAQNVRHYIYSF